MDWWEAEMRKWVVFEILLAGKLDTIGSELLDVTHLCHYVVGVTGRWERWCTYGAWMEALQ